MNLLARFRRLDTAVQVILAVPVAYLTLVLVAGAILYAFTREAGLLIAVAVFIGSLGVLAALTWAAISRLLRRP